MNNPHLPNISNGKRSRQSNIFNGNKSRQPHISIGNAEGSRLLNLPPELRNRIYEYTLSLGVVEVFRGRKEDTSLHASARGLSRQHRRNCLALLRANKQIYNEAANLFYFCNHFEVQPWLPGAAALGIADNNDLDDDNVLDLEERAPRCTMSALYKLLQRIGATGGGAPIHITFALGDVFGIDIEETSIPVLKRILEDLRTIQTTDTRMRLDASMKSVVLEGSDIPEGVLSLWPDYTVVLDPREPLTGISAFIAHLGDMFAQNSKSEVHDAEDLQDFDSFFRGLRKSIEKSPKWQQASEATREGDGQEEA
ncbi:hypothetical protein LTR27_002861 [Elasticomyces elasticus]|nr:hypothetical protein LTR27_002861 [Elasticomyces elasticus]